MKKTYFSFYHPITCILYFVIVCVLTLGFINPLFIFLNIICAVISCLALLGKEKTWGSLRYGLILFFTVTLINPFLNARGATVLFHIGSYHITFESMAYGMSSGGILLCIFLWINCFGSFFDTQKLMFLFSRFMQTITLMLSMCIKTFKDVKYRISVLMRIQKMQADAEDDKGIKQKFKTAVHLSTSLLGWTLEDSVDTIYSMKARGYGIAKRTFYKKYKFRFYDAVATFIFLLCMILQIIFCFEYAVAEYFPTIVIKPVNPAGIISYCIVLLYPVIVEVWEDIRLWHLQ